MTPDIVFGGMFLIVVLWIGFVVYCGSKLNLTEDDLGSFLGIVYIKPPCDDE